MTRHSRWLIAMVTVASLAVPAKAQNGGEGPSQDIISRQLEAFLSGDFARAYTFASPDIKRIFPTLERFMSMVQSGYLPVLRPGNYAFGRSEQLPDGRIQWEVLIDGPDGKGYTATYFMEKQEDGSWKVDAVSLRRDAPGMT